MDNERHQSLGTALYMTYMEIKEKECARALWELFTLFPDLIEQKAAEELIDGYEDALRTLVDLGVVHINDQYLSVQPTLRDYIKEADEYIDDFQAISQKLLDHYTGIYGEDGERNWGSEEAAYALERLSDALFLMNWLVDKKEVDDIGRLHCCICEYYQDASYEAIIPLEAAIALPGLQDGYIKANMLLYCGDLEMRTAKLEEAEEHYAEAEEVYRRIQDDLGLANVLKAQGDLEMRTAKLAEAERHYQEAEEVYRRIHADLGLANVLRAQGELLQERTDYSNAIDVYTNAIDLYEKTGEMMGLAYTVSELCYCYAKTGDVGNATACAERAGTILEGLPYENVKAYCAKKVRASLAMISSPGKKKKGLFSRLFTK